MSDTDRDNILAGIYRNLEAFDPREALRLLRSIAETLVLIGGIVQRASGVDPHGARPTQAALRVAIPEQGELPLAGAILKCRPRIWGSTVKFYNEAWMLFKGNAFILAELFDHREELTRATHGKVHLASFQRVLSALVRAGAATRKGGAYTLREPNDELREAVERVRNTKGGAR